MPDNNKPKNITTVNKTDPFIDYLRSNEGRNQVYEKPLSVAIDKTTDYDPVDYVVQEGQTSGDVIKELNYRRGENQGAVSEIGNAVLGGLGKLPFTVIGNVASILDFEDYNNVDKEVGNSITAWTEEQKGNIEEATKIYKSNDNTLGSREWWINNGKGLIDSAGAFVVTGALTGGAIGGSTALLGNGLKMLTQIKNTSNVISLGKNVASILTNATALNQAESVPIAMNVFKNSYELKMEEFSEAIDNGSMTKEDAEKLATDIAADAASYSININRLNIPLNMSSAGAFLRPASLTRQIAKDMSKKAIGKRLIFEGGQEYVEENVNMIAENEAMLKAKQGKDYSYNFNRTVNEVLSKQGFEQGIVGFVGGIAQTSLTESVYDKIKKDAPSYDNDGNVQYNNDGSPVLTSRHNSNVQKFNAQKKSLNNIESLAKSSSVPTVKETLDNLKESSELINDIQIASLKNEDIQVELLQNKLLSNQALSSFKNGTAGNLIDMYDSFAKDPSSKEKFGENYLSKISQAKSDIELLEDIYTQHSSLPQINESYKNRSEYLYTVRELEKSSLELSKVYSEQQKEISLTKTEDLDVINAMPITKKLNKQVENVGVLRERALLLNNDYNNIITDEFGKSIVNKNKAEEDNQVPEEVETPEVKTKKEAKAEEVDKELESKFNQLTTIDNFSDLNLLRNEIKNHPLHTKEMLNQINEKEKQLKSIINTFAENIINNTLENNDNNQKFLKNNLEDIEKRIQELKAIKDIKKPVFKDILEQSGVEPGSEIEPEEQTEEEVNAQQKLIYEANSQGLLSDNESTQVQIDSENLISSVEKGINVKNNVVMVHIFNHYFDKGAFKFERNDEGFPKDDNVSQIDINALNSLKIGDKLEFELVKVSSQVESIYRSLKDYDGKHIAIKNNGRLVGFVQQPHPVSPKSQDPAFSEAIRQELIEYRKQVISLINQGISVTEKVKDKGTGNLYTKINSTNSKRLIAADFNVFETARPQDKINGSLVFVYADQTGKLLLPKSSSQDISSSDITTINKRLNELVKFKLKPGRVYQLVKDLTDKWYPMPVYANNINSKTLDNIEEVLSFVNNSSETKNIIRDLQPYIYASSSRIGAAMAITKENNKISFWANGKTISSDDFNNVDVLRKEFLKKILGLFQNIDVININNPSVQEKMADRENLFTNVTTFEGEYFVQPYIEYTQNSMLRKEAPITNDQVNKLSAVQPSSKPSTAVSTDAKAEIERRRQETNNKNEEFWEQFTAINAAEVADRDNLLNRLLKNIPLPANARINNWALEELVDGKWVAKKITNQEEYFGKENWDKIKEAKNQFDIEFKKIEDSNLAKIKLIEQKQSDLLSTVAGLELRKAWSFGLIKEPNIIGLDETNFISKQTEFKNKDLVETGNYEGYYYLSKPNKDDEWYEQIIGKTEQEVEDKINAKYDAELTAEDIKKQLFKDKLNRANNAIVKEKGASKTLDNTILNRNLFEKWLKKNLPQLNLSDVNNVLALKDTIIDAFGLFKDSTIFLFEGAGMKTAYHEAFHGVFRNLLTVKQREEIISEAKTKYPAPTLEDLNNLQKDLKNQYTEQQLTYLYYEEKIADSFAIFANDKNSKSLLGKLSDAIIDFFNKIIQYFNFFKSKKTSALESLFDNINNGKLATIKSNSNSVVNIPIFNEYAYSKKLNQQLGVSNKSRTVEAIGNAFMAKYQEASLSNEKIVPLSVFQSVLDIYSEKLMSLDENSDDFALCGKIILNFPELISEVKKYLSIRNVKIKDEIQYKEVAGELTTLKDNGGIEITVPLDLDKVEDNEVYTLESKASKGFTDWTSISGLSSSSARLKLFLSSIPVLDYSKRVPVNVFDEFGIQKYWDFHELYVHIEDNLIDLYEFEEKIDKLKELSINRPELKQVINKLTNRPSNYNQEQFDLLQNDFDTNFNKQNLLYTLFKFDTDSSTGQTTHEIIESNRTSLARQLSDSWKSNVFDVNKKNIIGFYDKGEGKIDTKKAKKLLDEWNGLPENPKAKFINTKLLKAGIEYSNNTILKLVEENDPEWRKDVATVLEYYASGLDLSRQKTFREAMFRLVGKEVDNSKNKNSMSFIDGRNKNIFAVQLPTFISKTIVKIKNKDKFASWISKLQQDSFYKNSNILSLLKNKSDFKQNLKISYLDSSKDSRGTREGVSFTKMTPKDYAITQIVSFRNLVGNVQKETSLPINKYFYLTPEGKSMQVIIDSTSTQVMVDSKGELLIESSPIIYNGQGNMHYYNVFLQEANRIKTNIDIKNDIILNNGKGKYKLNMLLENYHMSKENFQEVSKLAVKDELTEDDVNNLSKMFNGFAYKFNCFSNSFNKTLGKDLIEIIENSTKDNLESNLESIKKQVVTGIAKDIQDDFNTTLKEMLFKGVIEKNNKTGLYSSKTIELVKNIDKVTNEEVKRTDQKVSDDILNILVEFSANTKLNNIEFSNILNGDIAKYKARNLAKRAPQAQTMTVFGHFINKIIKTRVVKDVFSKLSTKEYDDIYDSLKDSGLSDSEIKSTIDPYLKTNSTDAQVYISPELYKRIHVAQGNWSPEMQSAYDIAEGSVISEIPQSLRRKLLGIKPFYFGDRFNEDLSIMDFEQVKCSMIPLFKSYTDLNPLLADIRKDMLKKDKNGNTTLDMVAHESAFKATLGFRNDIFDSTGSVTLDLNTDNFGIQTSNVDHIEDGNDSTRQIKMLMFSAIDPNKSYRGTNGKELIDLINKLEATNIKQSLKEVLVKMNVKDNVEFSKFIEASISKRKENINVEEGLLLENGDFKYALDSGNLSTQVENLISSVFTDNAVKQEFEIGGDAVQASSVGFKFKSEFKNLLEQQKNLTKEALLEQGKLKWIKPNKENGYIEFAEAAMPAWTKKFFNEKGFLIDAENIPEELRELITYRIPTGGLHSMIPIRVVKFLPETMGNFILLPDQIVTQFGSDFDFDKIFFIGKDFYKTINEDKEEYFRPYTYYFNQNETGLRYNDYLQYTSLNKLDQMDFNYFSKLSIEEQNVRPARNNEIINCYFKVLTEIKNLNLLIKPSSFEVLTKFKKDNFSQEVEENYFSSSTQRELKDKNHVAIDLKGQVALHVTGHSYGTLMNLNTASYIKVDKNKSKLNLDKTVNIDGEKRTNFSGLYNEDGQLISDVVGSVLDAVLDDTQNPILKTLGIDNNTVDVFISILRSGKSLNDALTFIAQPIIKELSANLINNTNKIKEFNQGQFSVDDLISICKTNAKESLSKIKDNDNPSISMFFDKIEDNEFYIKTKDIKQYVDNFDKDNFIKTADELEVLKYWSNQARALKQFKNIEIISKELVKTNKIFAINKEVGPNIEDIISKKQILLDLLDSKVLNGFDLRRIPSLEATWSVHTAALNWFGNYFPYGSKKYMEIKEYLAFQQGSKNIAEYPVKDRIFMNSFIRTFTDYKSFLFQDVDKEYVKLLRELPAQINDIFKFHEEEKFLGTTSYNVLRNNVFLKEIKEYQDKDNENYYLQLRGNRLNLQVKNNVISGLTALYKSEDPMVREFAIDLIKHSFLSTGFFKGVNSYASLISPEILDDLKVEGVFPGETTTELQSYNEFRKNAIYNLNSDFAPNLPALRIIKQMIRNNPRVFTKVFDSKMFTEDSTNGLPKTITTNKLKIKDAKRLNDMLWEDSDGMEYSPLIISVFDEYNKQVKLYERNDSNVINSETKDDFSTITYDEITPLGKIGNLIEIYINEENPVSRLKNNNSDEESNDQSESEILGQEGNIELNNNKIELDETQTSVLPTTQSSTSVKRVYQGYDKLDNREFNYFTQEESEAKDYGANVREVELNTTGFLKIDNKDEYYNKVNEFSKISGIRFDILNNSKIGLENQAAFFKFLKAKGYKGLDMLGGVDSKYAVSFTNQASTQLSTSVEIEFQEEQTTGYKNRTIKNASADATIALAVDFNSAGEKLTKNSVLNQGKKYIARNLDEMFAAVEPFDLSKGYGLNDNAIFSMAEGIVRDLNSVNAKTLNIAGNGIYTMKNKYSQNLLDEAVERLLEYVIYSDNLENQIVSIRTGGQTGIDEAGAKAGIKLQLPTTVLAPKGWTFRNIAGQDISNEQQFKARFKVTQPSTNVESKTSSIPSERQIKVEQFNITIKPDGKMFYENGNEVTDQTTKNKVNVRKELQDKTLRSSVYNGANYFVLSDDRIVGSGKTNLGKESITDNTIKEKILAKAVTYKKEC